MTHSKITNPHQQHKSWYRLMNFMFCFAMVIGFLVVPASAASCACESPSAPTYICHFNGTHTATCSSCGQSWEENCSYSSPTAATCDVCKNKTASVTDADIDGMKEFAFQAYKLICILCVPLGIISLAFCGFKILGAIFLGTLNSASDMAKIRKRIVYTILMLLFVVLLPYIFNYALTFFKATAWKP